IVSISIIIKTSTKTNDQNIIGQPGHKFLRYRYRARRLTAAEINHAIDGRRRWAAARFSGPGLRIGRIRDRVPALGPFGLGSSAAARVSDSGRLTNGFIVFDTLTSSL
ncbi:hypothetical protein GWI33_000813, partial [Rhynchophorus ferrugineus]